MAPSFALSLVGLFFFLNLARADDVQVNSPKGQFVGEGLTVDGRTVFRFLGIPYAKPPLGPLRFARPQPVDNEGDNYQAKQWPPICVQNTKSPMAGNSAHMGKAKNMSEDCLYLNIWSPAELKLGSTDQKSDQLKPVIVWIHGGKRSKLFCPSLFLTFALFPPRRPGNRHVQL